MKRAPILPASPRHLWKQARKDPAGYRRLMIEHGRGLPGTNQGKGHSVMPEQHVSGNAMPVAWIKSSFSFANGNSVEVRAVTLDEVWQDEGIVIAVRDSKHPDLPALGFNAAEWKAFVAGVKSGEFDLPQG